MKDRITVFISYSWDSDSHKEWVLKLANYLIEKAGCNVLLDQFDLAAGKELTHFMENGLETADKVLVILTEEYKKRADGRTGGTGFEYSLISQGLYDLQANNDKFIPILRQGSKQSSAPIYLATKIYHSMKDDSTFEIDAFKLSREIYNKPEIKKPELGDIPDFDNPDFRHDPIISVANAISTKEKLNRELDNLLESAEGVTLTKKEIDNLFMSLAIKAREYNDKTEFTFKVEKNNRQTSILVMSSGYTVTFESYIRAWNSARGAELIVKMWNGYKPVNEQNAFTFSFEKPQIVTTTSYTVDLDDSKHIIWRDKENNDIVTNSQKLNREAFVFIIKSIQEEKQRNFRK